MSSVRIGKVKVTPLPPRIAVTIDRPTAPAQLARIARQGGDIIEVRLDRFPFREEGDLVSHLRQIRSRTSLPLIATIRKDSRHPFPLSEPRRKKLFLSILPLVEAVDVEVTAPIAAEVIRAARARGKTTIGSYHNYQLTPSYPRLILLRDRFFPLHADLFKLATLARKPEDTVRLLEFTRRDPFPLITTVMGKWAAAYRALSPLFGSRLNYAYFHEPVSPGQPSLTELKSLNLKLYPRR